MKLKIAIVILLFVGVSRIGYCQDSTKQILTKDEQLQKIKIEFEKSKSARKVVGKPIRIVEFNNLVDKFSNMDERKIDRLSIGDLIIAVRIRNTIGERDTLHKDRYNKFVEVFNSNFLKVATIKLNASISKGMILYSKKYNIYIGNTAAPHKNSLYAISFME